jgi:two-component system heavy metal sensor histidine kinase CusS
MHFGPLDPLLRSLRFRLTFWNATALVALLAAALVGVRAGVYAALVRELDEQLTEDAAEVGLIVARFGPDAAAVREALNRKADGHKFLLWYVQTFTAAGPGEASDSAVDAPLRSTGVIRGGSVSRGGFRVIEKLVAQPSGPAVRVRVGASLQMIDEDLGRLTQIMLVVAGVLAVGVPAWAWWLAGRATRPLGDIIGTSGRLRPEKLDDRLPVRGVGDELDQLALTVNGFLDRLNDYLERKRDFLADAAHELRSPLTALRAAVEAALACKCSPEEMREVLGGVVEECDALAGLVNRLLLLAESDAGRLTPGTRRVAFHAVVGKAVDMFRWTAEDRGVTLEADLRPVTVPGEPTHLRQVVQNLLDNAIKYTPAGGTISVSLARDPGNGDALFVVRDTGAGIAPEHLPRVCERFFRADRSRPRDGTGLGLSICHAIISSYGGRLTIESAPDRGTRVSVRLPAPGPNLTEM